MAAVYYVQNILKVAEGGGELERLMEDNQRILEQGQEIMRNNQVHYDNFMRIYDNMKNNQTQGTIPQDSNWLNDFVNRGNFSNSSLNNHQYGIMNQDYWADFVTGVIKKSLWLLWNSFIGIAHWLCLLIAVAGIIAFIAGYKKGGVVSICSVLFYVLLKLINLAIGG